MKRPTRRQVLVGGTLTGAGLAVGAGIYLPPPLPGGHVLSAAECEIVGALGEVLFPRDNPIGVDWEQAGLAQEVDRLLVEAVDPAMVRPFRYLLRYIQVGALFRTGSRFSQASLEDRKELLAEWSAPGTLKGRLVDSSVKGVLGMAYFNHPDVLNAVGWRLGCRLGEDA